MGPSASKFVGLLGEGKQQILLHAFERGECVNSEGNGVQRFILITDQTLFICDGEGNMIDAMQVDEIQQIDYGPAAEQRLGIRGPPDGYDFLIDFPNTPTRPGEDSSKIRIVKTLFAVYKRMKEGQNLKMDDTASLTPSNYRLHEIPPKPPNVGKQRSEEHLLVALKNFEKQEEETIKWVEYMQNELETEHAERISDKDRAIQALRDELEESRHRSQAQNDEIGRLQRIHRIALGLDEDISTEGMDEKDKRIYEMQKKIVMLSEKERQLQSRLAQINMGGNFFERDLDGEVKNEPTRPQGGALSVQGLVEVLQDQLHNRNTDIQDMQFQLEELEKMRRNLKDKDALISALRTQAASAGGVGVPSGLYDEAPRFDTQASSPYDSYAGVPSAGIGDFHGGAGGGGYYGGVGQDGVPESYYAQADPQGYSGPQEDPRPFQGTPYKSILPKSPEDMIRHPITFLPLIQVPRDQDFAMVFRGLERVVLHMFEVVKKLEKSGSGSNRVLLVTDANVYRCTLKGIVNRCSPIADIKTIYQNNNNELGLQMRNHDKDYDMMYQFPNRETMENCIRIILQIQSKMKNGVTAKVLEENHIRSHLQFKRPQDYEFRLHSATPIDRLYEKTKILDDEQRRRHDAAQVAERQRHERNEFSRIQASHDAHQAAQQQEADAQHYAEQDYYQQDASMRHALESLKTDLRREFQTKKDAEYQRLRDQVAQLEADYEDKSKELQEVRTHWKQHRCHKGKRPNIPAKQADGMFWIPTEPTLIECQLEVLKVQFWDNILITSHANGFLNVWDIDTVELIRTLKDHTAKVVAFQYDGVELISGSYDSTIRRWNVTDGTCINVITAHRGHVTCLQFDRNILVSGSSDSTIQVWQMDVELRRIRTLRGHKNAVECLKFQRDVLISAESGWLFLWDLEQGTVARAFRDEQGGITCLDFSDQWILTGGYAGALTMWSMSGEYETVHGHSDDISHIQLEGAYAVTSSADCSIRMWDLVNFKSLGVFNNSYPYECSSFQFIANRFVAVEQKTVKIWTK